MAGIGVSGIMMITGRFVGIESLAAVIAVCLIYSVANTCYWQLMPSMLYDVCEVEELVSGKKHSGSVISLQALSESLSIAVGMQALGIALEMAGFANEAAVQPENALAWVSNMFTLVPGAFMVLVFIIMLKYPINKNVFHKVMDVKSKKAEGLDVDMSELENLFK